MMWRSVSIPGKPTILMVDASRNLMGWEFEFCDRLGTNMRRRGLLLKDSAPVRVDWPEDLAPHLEPQDTFNCILLFSHAEGEQVPPGARLTNYWSWLNQQVALPPKLFASCTWENYDPDTTREILESPDSFAPLALAPESPLTPREAGLFFLKFFTELALHSVDAVTGRMVWFSSSKARELLRRRRMAGKLGVRC